jgi:hypothetical protein
MGDCFRGGYSPTAATASSLVLTAASQFQHEIIDNQTAVFFDTARTVLRHHSFGVISVHLLIRKSKSSKRMSWWQLAELNFPQPAGRG